MSLVEKIRKLSADKGLSIAKLEKELGLSSNSISKWDKSCPAGDKLVKVAKFFDVTTDYLLGNTELSNLSDNMPEIYFHLLQGAKELDLSQRDINILLDIAKRLKEEDDKD